MDKTAFQVETRNVVFITHANPEDNPFAIWLGAKLASAGYEVWADVLSLRGGQDWQRLLEDAIRHRACKLLVAANQLSVSKQGVRNEIQIASDTAKKLGDHNFIIPLKLGPYDAPLLVAHAQYINFEQPWAVGLAELLETLQETYKVPRAAGNIGTWLDLQLINGKKLTDTTERLISSWLEVRRLPEWIYYNPDFGSVPRDYPKVQYRDGAITCVKQTSTQSISHPTLAGGRLYARVMAADQKRRCERYRTTPNNGRLPPVTWVPHRLRYNGACFRRPEMETRLFHCATIAQKEP